MRNRIPPCLPWTKISVLLCSWQNGKVHWVKVLQLHSQEVAELLSVWRTGGGCGHRICLLGHKRHTICSYCTACVHLCECIYVSWEGCSYCTPMYSVCAWMVDGTLTAEFQGLILGEHPQSDYLHQTQHHGDDTLIASWLKSWGELAGWKWRDTKLQENKPVDHLILAC